MWFLYIDSYYVSALPGSLATTAGISIDFFSSGYLDVSVHQVRFLQPIYSAEDDRVLSLCGFPHSDISGSKFDCQLPEAFRRLPRPSSPVIAKASAMYAYSLDHIIGIRLIIIMNRPNYMTNSSSILLRM